MNVKAPESADDLRVSSWPFSSVSSPSLRASRAL
jgi:hypothetical protein